MKKQLLSVSLVLIMLLTLFSGCGNTPANEAPASSASAPEPQEVEASVSERRQKWSRQKSLKKSRPHFRRTIP